MKKKLAELKAKLAGLKDRIEADDKEAIAEGEKLRVEIETTEAAIAEAEKKAKLLSIIGQKTLDDNHMPVRNLGEHFTAWLKTVAVTKRFNLTAPEFKAASDPMTSPAGAVDCATTFDRTVVTRPVRRGDHQRLHAGVPDRGRAGGRSCCDRRGREEAADPLR